MACGCDSGDKPAGAPAAAGSSAAIAPARASASAGAGTETSAGSPLSPEVVAGVVNPKKQAPYAGPTGTLRGVVRIEGDPPPVVRTSFPAKCGEAAATHGKAFRTGQDGTVGDVLVTVIGYDAFVPAKDEVVRVDIRGCAFSTRTIAMTFGQRLEVRNVDGVEGYMPFLDGAPRRLSRVAIPGGEPIRLYPEEPAATHYILRDELPNPWLTADVFVLKFSTHDVTGLDGRYEIAGIPVGPVAVDALLPAINAHVERRIEIKPGDNQLDLTLRYTAEQPAKAEPAKKK